MLYVNPATGSDSANGSQTAPLKSLTRALQQAKSGDAVQLSTGTYSTANGEVFPIVIPAGVTVQGNESTKGSGILIQGSGQYISPTFARQNITFRMENNSKLRGVTVTNPDTRGTGVWIESTNPTIANCTFTACKREGVFATGTATPSVLDCVAIQNDANGFSVVRNAKGEWRRNLCQKTGFGMAISDSAAPLLTDNRFVENRSGLVLTQESRPVLRNNIIERNSSEGLVTIERALPDLGKAQEPAGNIFRDNAEYDINNNTSLTIISVGNQVNPAKIRGAVDLVGGEVPTPTPTSTPTPTPTPTPTGSPGPGGFTDTTGHWAAPFIQALVSRNLVSGFPDGTFKPEAPITRAQYAAVISNAFNLPAKQPVATFSDVPQSFWAFPFIREANQMGFISGFPDGSFRPDQNLTRVQAIVSLVSGLGLTGGTPGVLTIYTDRAQVPSYATDRVATATQQRMVVNYPNVRQLDPMRDCTRAEMVAMVYQSLVALNQAPAISSPYIVNPSLSTAAFTDIQGHWAEAFISGLAAQNLIGGFPDGSFKPDLPMNRAQYASLIVGAFNPAPKRDGVTFADVPNDFWAKSFIDRAYRAGFISGFPDGTFQPAQNVLRLQVFVSLVSGLGYPAGNTTVLTAYDDRSSIPQYAQNQIAAATQRDMVVNYPNVSQLNPNRDATRAEVAATVYQALVQAGRAVAINSPYIVNA